MIKEQYNKNVNSNTPLISVMVAVYNTELYIRKCLDSILNQSYRNIELIIINDGSTDSSPKICDEYAKRDARVKVIHKENGGLSDARNKGLAEATGEYYGFIDSDDWIKPEMYSRLLNLIISHDADIAGCEPFHDENTYTQETFEIRELKNEEFMPLVLADTISSHVWKYLFKKELFNGVSFTKGYVAQDMLVFHDIANKADQMVLTNEKLYFYFIDRQDNTSNSLKGMFKGTMCRSIAFVNRYALMKNEFYDKELEQILLKKTTRFIIASFCRVTRADWDIYSLELKTLQNFLSDNKKLVIKSNNIRLLEKVSVLVILLNKYVMMCAYKYLAKLIKI